MSDRRAERRRQTIDEIVTTALDVMAQAGAAGLSLGAVATRMGIRTPSLYGYFASKAALCDEIFARGWSELRAVMAPHYQRHRDAASDFDVRVELRSSLTEFVGWALEHRASAELMFWRPIPGWEPSAAAYRPAVELLDDLGAALGALQDHGLLTPEAATAEMADVITVLSTGVISQQLSNEPGVTLRLARYAARLDVLVDMFLYQFSARERVR